ncbi:MAG TPA: SdrD B-like domain-containing protein [Candidatus Krumholzibacteria bacterium]|nr:SdrD B-like domain-containing protein [Candidatus Krumholzibacteria bacterium]
MRPLRALFALSMAAAMLTACGNDSVKPADSPSATQVQGEIGQTDFELTFPYGDDHSRLLEGPFVLRGTALHYDSLAQALTVDLTITNRGAVAHPEPVGLTFVRLFPAGVTVLNPDNDIHGDGAAIVFQFANDDGVWTPRETSLPRTVQFGVERGQAVGFIGQINIAAPTHPGGSISGRVWNDTNKDGVMDAGEPGLPGVPLTLRSIGGEPGREAQIWSTRTAPDGNYRFDGLRAGAYIVSKALATVAFFPTTPTEITVLLSATDDGVSSFTGANFGCVPNDVPPPLPVGAYVEVTGTYLPEPDRIVAREIWIRFCSDPADSAASDGIRCNQGRLRGPVTLIGITAWQFAVMGAWVVEDATVPPMISVGIGDRVDVLVHRAGNALPLIADDIQKWDGEHEQVHGRVEGSEVGPNGVLRVRVLDVLVVIGEDTVIHRQCGDGQRSRTILPTRVSPPPATRQK